MAVPKVRGIETEWGIGVKDEQGFRPAETIYFYRMIKLIREFFGFPPDPWVSVIREVENRVGFSHHNLLPNGGRLYIDAPHLEYSTPECLSAKTLVAADRAGEEIVDLARSLINRELAQKGEEIIIYKDNTDRCGNSYGCHENYLVTRDVFERICSGQRETGCLASFFISRLIFTGAGKIGVENRRAATDEPVFQISQRADFMEEVLGLNTINRRSLVNTRNEPHADPRRFGRLHVIVGDANLSEIATYMKTGITAIVLKMMEDRFLPGDIAVANPVQAIKLASMDLTCQEPVLETLRGRRLSTLNLSEIFFERAREYFSKIQEPTPEELDLLRLWEETNSDFRTGNKAKLRRRFDWQIKLGLFEDFLEECGLSWGKIGRAVFKSGSRKLRVSTLLHLKDVLYHDMAKERGIYWACKEDGDIEELVTRSDVTDLIQNPPSECRSYFRGRCIAKFFSDIETMDWDEIIFRGDGICLAIGLSNPAWGGKADTGLILDRSETIAELIVELMKLNNTKKGGA